MRRVQPITVNFKGAYSALLFCCGISVALFRLWLKEFFVFRRDDVISDEKMLWAVEQLKNKSKQLDRLPKKDDFDEVTRSRIKAFLGPWPRALEAAGLKEPANKKRKKK